MLRCYVIGWKVWKDNKILFSPFYMAPFGSQQNNCTAFSIDICTIRFLALKVIALRIKYTPLGRRWEYDLVKKE